MRQLLTFIGIVVLAAAALWYSLSPEHKPALGLDLRGGMRVTLEPDERQLGNTRVTPETMDQVRGVLESRVNNFGLSGSDVRLKSTVGGKQQVLIVLPGVQKPEEALAQISKVAQLEFRHLDNTQSKRYADRRYRMDIVPGDTAKGEPDTYKFFDTVSGKPIPQEDVLKEAQLILRGNSLKPVSKAEIDPTNGQPIVTFEFKPDGARTFGEFTTNHVNEILAVVLDNQIISAPNIETAITEGHGRISGGFKNMAEARLLANLLNSGALPIPLKPAETQYVGATLGQKSIDQSVHAGLFGLALVLVFMLLYYWLPGALACIALIIYAAITFSIFKGFPFWGIPPIVLDLPGITGFILSVGMAVDANVLIFERLKEELRSGKSLHAAIDAGFNRAFSSILDSNVTTWIVCAILIWLGAPIIKGFAITLAIGVAVSMFTAITVTRTLLHLVVALPWARNPALYGLNMSWLYMAFPAAKQGGILRVFEKRRIYFGFTIALGIIALVFLLMTPFGKGLQPGIDFTGGSVVEAAFHKPATQDDVRKVVQEVGVHDATISMARSEQPWTRIQVQAQDVDQATQRLIQDRLSEIHGYDASSYQAAEAAAAKGAPAAAPAGTNAPAAGNAPAPGNAPAAGNAPAGNAPAANAPASSNAPAANAPGAANSPAANAPGNAPAGNTPAGNAPAAAKPAPGAKPASGGKTFTVTALFTSDVSEAEVRSKLTGKGADNTSLDLRDLQVTRTVEAHNGSNAIPVALIQAQKLTPELQGDLKKKLDAQFGIVEPMYQASSIGPSVAKEVTLNAFASVLVASLAIILYLAFRFAIGGFINGLKFGTCAVIALIHDVGIVVGLFALFGFLFHWQVDSLFVTAALTILGFSVHDTIVVYDRIRENLLHRQRGETFADVSDRSITQTFDRSINTSLTVLLVVAALVIFGGGSIRQFNVALLIGIAIGTYSSIFVASPLVVMWERMAAAREGRAPVAAPTRPSGRQATPATRREPASVATRPTATRPPAVAGDGEAADESAPGARPKPGGGGAIRPKRKRRL